MGFRSLHSTVLALNKATDSWLFNIDKGRLNSVIFLDIKKAFEAVNDEILLKKLNRYGVCEKELDFLMSFLSDRVLCCSINGNISSFQNVKYGVPLGSILGPLLFIIYMNHLPMAVENSKISMYADDIFISNETRSKLDIREEFYPDFIKMYEWLKANKLSLNFLKTKFMVIGNPRKYGELKGLLALRVGDSLIRRVKQTKSLGVIIDQNLSWEILEY